MFWSIFFRRNFCLLLLFIEKFIHENFVGLLKSQEVKILLKNLCSMNHNKIQMTFHKICCLNVIYHIYAMPVTTSIETTKKIVLIITYNVTVMQYLVQAGDRQSTSIIKVIYFCLVPKQVPIPPDTFCTFFLSFVFVLRIIFLFHYSWLLDKMF